MSEANPFNLTKRQRYAMSIIPLLFLTWYVINFFMVMIFK